MTLKTRERIVLVLLILAFGIVSAKLFYWQVVLGSELQQIADNQYYRTVTNEGSRGSIFTADGFPLVLNQEVYRLFAQPKILKEKPELIADKLIELLLGDGLTSDAGELGVENPEEKNPDAESSFSNNPATERAIIKRSFGDHSVGDDIEQAEIKGDLRQSLLEKLSNKDSNWVSLYTGVTKEQRDKIIDLNFFGIGFDPYEVRYYPEASMAAHITGFVGKNESGQDEGYFGIEGALNKELQARSDKRTIFTDALGLTVAGGIGGTSGSRSLDGRDITLTIRRDIQHLIETELLAGIEKYDAKSGEIIVMEPQTGKILGMASYPNYDQDSFTEYPTEYYKNPSVADLYEPGSTFKVLTVATGIDLGVITPNTVCTKCSGPRQYSKFTIRTWNDVYNPDISIEQGLAKSDNTAMIFVAEKIGADQFAQYLKKFAIGDPTEVDLQEDSSAPFPKKWGPVELATISFGQGITTNSLQLTRAIASIANHGELVQPIIVDYVTDKNNGERIYTPTRSLRSVISPSTAKTVTQMMVTAAQSGEAQWTASKTHKIAGKTGTSQVVSSSGYSADKTIATFIGFSPPENPRFIMLVKLNEPKSSPWAAETAAPLWYKIAEKLYLLLNIPPDQ